MKRILLGKKEKAIILDILSLEKIRRNTFKHKSLKTISKIEGEMMTHILLKNMTKPKEIIIDDKGTKKLDSKIKILLNRYPKKQDIINNREKIQRQMNYALLLNICCKNKSKKWAYYRTLNNMAKKGLILLEKESNEIKDVKVTQKGLFLLKLRM